MNKPKERQFIDVVEQVLEEEHISLSRVSEKRDGGSYFVSGLATRRMENALIYLICKKLLDEKGFFHTWSLAWEDNYPCNSRQHCDITMTNNKPSPAEDPNELTKNPGPWDFIEFGYSYPKKKIEKDVKKLANLEDADGFQCGGRYIVMFSVVGEREAQELKEAPNKNNLLNDREWLLKREDIREFSLGKGYGVFAIEFFKLTKHKGAS